MVRRARIARTVDPSPQTSDEIRPWHFPLEHPAGALVTILLRRERLDKQRQFARFDATSAHPSQRFNDVVGTDVQGSRAHLASERTHPRGAAYTRRAYKPVTGAVTNPLS